MYVTVKSILYTNKGNFGPTKTAPTIFLKIGIQAQNYLKNYFFWSLTPPSEYFSSYWGPKYPKNDFFSKNFLKFFLVIDYDSAGYYLLFRPKSAHFKGPKTPKNLGVKRGH